MAGLLLNGNAFGRLTMASKETMARYGILVLSLLFPLSGTAGPDGKRISAPKTGARSPAKPAWARDLPPEPTVDNLKELRRKMAERGTVHLQAVVRAFAPVALSSINRDFSPGVHVSGTRVEVASPAKYKGLDLLVHHQRTPTAESCWRVLGCKVEFDFYERHLEARQAKLRGLPFIYDRDLTNLAMEKPAPAAVHKDAGP